MGACVNTGVDPNPDGLNLVLRPGNGGDALNLKLRVDHYRTHISRYSASNLNQRLVVAVQTNARAIDSRS